MATLQPALQLLETAFNANTMHMPPLSQMDDLKLSEFSAAHLFPYISPVTGSAERIQSIHLFYIRTPFMVVTASGASCTRDGGGGWEVSKMGLQLQRVTGSRKEQPLMHCTLQSFFS